jgi:hypothetical protein
VEAENPRMARPVRKLWKMRTMVRRRHRTWMFSMCMASLGWAIWWVSLLIVRLAPGHAPDFRVTAWSAGAFAAIGFLAALWSFRAKLAWILFMLVPMFANGSLLAVPWVVKSLRLVDVEHTAAVPDQASH